MTSCSLGNDTSLAAVPDLVHMFLEIVVERIRILDLITETIRSSQSEEAPIMGVIEGSPRLAFVTRGKGHFKLAHSGLQMRTRLAF